MVQNACGFEIFSRSILSYGEPLQTADITNKIGKHSSVKQKFFAFLTLKVAISLLGKI